MISASSIVPSFITLSVFISIIEYELNDEPLQKVKVRLQLALYALKVEQPELMVNVMFLPPLLVLQLALPEVRTHVHELRYITTWLGPVGTMLKVFNAPPFNVPVQLGIICTVLTLKKLSPLHPVASLYLTTGLPVSVFAINVMEVAVLRLVISVK